MENAIVFDMDGVLFDTERVCKFCWMKICDDIGMKNGGIALRDCTGLNRQSERAYFEKNYPEIDFTAFINRLSKDFRAYIDEHGMPIKTGTVELLTWLRENKWKTALASSSRKEAIMHHLEVTNLTDMFDAIISGDMVTNGKPDPEIYLTACEMLHADPKSTYAVEDSRNGLHSAHNAGMKAILVPDLIEPTPDMLEIAFLKKDTLLDVLDYLKNAQ